MRKVSLPPLLPWPPKCDGCTKENVMHSDNKGLNSLLVLLTTQYVTLTMFYDFLLISFLICKRKWKIMINILFCPIPSVYNADYKWEKKKQRQSLPLGWEKHSPQGDSRADFKLLTFYRVQVVNLNNKMAGSFWNSQSDFCYLWLSWACIFFL